MRHTSEDVLQQDIIGLRGKTVTVFDLFHSCHLDFVSRYKHQGVLLVKEAKEIYIFYTKHDGGYGVILQKLFSPLYFFIKGC